MSLGTIDITSANKPARPLRQIIILDDLHEGAFGPLLELREMSQLRNGAFTLRERLTIFVQQHKLQCEIQSNLDIPLQLPSDEDRVGDVMWINAHAIETGLIEQLLVDGHCGDFVDSNARLIARRMAIASAADVEQKHETFSLNDVSFLDYPWQILDGLTEHIKSDLSLQESLDVGVPARFPLDVVVRGAENISVTGDVRFGAGAMLDASLGKIRLEDGCRIGAGAILTATENAPIWLDRHVQVMPGAILTGPIYIGPESIVRQGARLNGNIVLGPQCRVGGELNEVLMQGYSNKQHSGYLGTSIVGEWVNLGAATDNSDLKNNYRPVDLILDGQKRETGKTHFGVVLGDFVRSAIQTRLNTGTVIGACCNLFGADFPDKSVPPFVWCRSEGYQEYHFDKAIETIRMVMQRRGRNLDADMLGRLTVLFDTSRASRRDFLKERRGSAN